MKKSDSVIALITTPTRQRYDPKNVSLMHTVNMSVTYGKLYSQTTTEKQNARAPEEGKLQATDTGDDWMSDMDQVHNDTTPTCIPCMLYYEYLLHAHAGR